MSVSPFRGLKDKTHELIINGVTIKVKPKVEDIEMFITMKKEMTGEDAKKITAVLKQIISRANPEEDKEDIEVFIMENYGDLVSELTILFGFTTREQVEKLKTEVKKKAEEDSLSKPE